MPELEAIFNERGNTNPGATIICYVSSPGNGRRMRDPRATQAYLYGPNPRGLELVRGSHTWYADANQTRKSSDSDPI